MLSLITTEQCDLALINSTDMTIRNPPQKIQTTQLHVKMQPFSSNPHAPGINCRWPGQDRGAAGRRTTALTREVSIVNARWAEMMLIVEL